MIYLTGVVCIISLFYIVRGKQRMSSLFLLAMLLSFILSIVFIMLYLARDNFYFRIISRYLGVDWTFWRNMFNISINRGLIIRILNICNAFFIYSSIGFSILFAIPQKKKMVCKLLIMLAVPLLLQVVLFDLHFYVWLFIRVCPRYISIANFKAVYDLVTLLAKAVNTLFLSFGVLIFAISYFRAPSIQLMKRHILLTAFCHVSIVAAFCFIFSWMPSSLVNMPSSLLSYSAADAFNLYMNAPSRGNFIPYDVFPYLITMVFLLVTFFAFRYSVLYVKMRGADMELFREIDAATVTSRLFCHYLKNELIALLTETEELTEQIPENLRARAYTGRISDRCQEIYKRLDVVHHGTKNTQLRLKPGSVSDIIDKLVKNIIPTAGDITWKLKYPEESMIAMVDEAYFSQAVHNIILNAVEALRNHTGLERIIEISVKCHNQWILLSVGDNGPGILPENLENIFNPFFTTKPVSQNWGIGLSMCRKIITAHEGKISAASKLNEGTTFTIMLPLLRIGS